jgi:ATP-dependent DNA helicase RecG
VFDEFLLLQLGLLRRRQALRSRPGPELSLLPSSQGLVQDFKDLLSFQFTEAQQRVLQEIEGDLSQSKPMARLVQGDVGSGKTVVAIAALLSTIEICVVGCPNFTSRWSCSRAQPPVLVGVSF